MAVTILPPLGQSGSALQIPRASATQDGYLSKNDFILFSHGSAVPVTSWNMRTGDVVLLSDDVLAALGYLPLDRAGDTMTGPLTLARNPTGTLEAATKAYVDSISAGLIAGLYLASSFKASGSKLKFTGAINSGSKTLTLTAASDFEAGQGIFITGAGAGGANLLTKVDAVSGTTITLHDPAGTTRSSTNVQHDDTVALQTAIDALGTNDSGTLIMEPGFYRVNGPRGPYHSILRFPFVSAVSDTAAPACYRIIAYNVPVAPGAGLPQDGGVIIQSDVVDTAGSILASGNYLDSSLSAINYSIVSIEGITFRTYDNPQISCLDLGVQWNTFLKNVSFDTGMAGQSNVVNGGTLPGGAQPTHGTFALRLARLNTCTQIRTENVTISNYGIGVIGSELWHTTLTWIQRCGIGVQAHGAGQDANYPIVGDLLIVQCPISIDCSPGRLRFDVHVDFESDFGGWWSPSAHLYDPNSIASGLIRYINISAGSGGGASIPINVTGGSKVSLQHIDGLGVNFANNALAATGNVKASGDLDVHALTSRGALTVFDGAAEQVVSFGLADSGGSGKRQVIIPNASANPSLLTGLLSYWDMNESVGSVRADKTGHSPMDVPSGGYINPTVVSGRLGNAAHGGTNQYLYCPDNPFQHFAGSMSIAGWLNITTLGGYQTVLSKVSKATDLSFIIWWRPDTAAWEFRVSNNGSSVVAVTVPHTPTVNTWYHIAAVFDSSANQIRLRINDGAIGASSASFTGPIYNTTTTNFGTLAVYQAGFIFGDCAVDELGVWNKALVSGEITALAAGITYPF